jgi:hypothetical protein
MEIQQLNEQGGVENSSHAETGFWERQFTAPVTRPQIVFDVAFGVVAPILCFVFDPIVLKSWFPGPPLFPDYQIIAYLFSGLQIILLGFWLLTGPSHHILNSFMGGMLFAGAVFCLIAGLVLAPFSLIGLALAIGAFGFTPFLTGLVYLRNSVRAMGAGNDDPVSLKGAMVSLSGIVLVTALCFLLSVQIHVVVSRAVIEIVEGDSQQAMFAAHRLMPLRFFIGGELDKVVYAYTETSDEKRKELLKSCYREITGDSIENRAHILQD